MTLIRRVVLPFALGLSACTVGPEYHAPQEKLASQYAEGATRPIGEAHAQNWWQGFHDPMLNELVQTGLAQNLGIKTALARMAGAQAAVSGTGLSSQVEGPISAEATRPRDGSSTNKSASFSPSIMLDLFGGTRRSREQALAELQSAQLGVGEARLAFLSSLISSYIDLRYYQEALAITRQTVTRQSETLAQVQQQRRNGTATELDEAQAQASLDATRATQPTLESGFYASSYAIATLLAVPAQELLVRLERGRAQPAPRTSASVGVPADLLRNRPDIASAERDYAAAVAVIGVSEAEFYPSVSLGGSISTSQGTSWTYGPSISIPLFRQGVLRSNRDQAVAQAEQKRLAWRTAVLSAVEEVQVAQGGYLRNRRAVAAYRRSTASYQRVVDLSQGTYQAGTTTLQDLLESQNALASANLSLASGLRDMANSWAALQVAAGLGWSLPDTLQASN